MKLTEFLQARIDEDEATAREGGFWGNLDLSEWEHAVVHQAGRIQTVSVHGVKGYEDHVAITHDYEGLSDSVSEEAGPHIARYDPARALAECEAKRHVLDESLVWGEGCLDVMARYLAEAYDDHPDYDQDWRP